MFYQFKTNWPSDIIILFKLAERFPKCLDLKLILSPAWYSLVLFPPLSFN